MEKGSATALDAIFVNDKESEDVSVTSNTARARSRFCHGKFRLFGHYVHSQFVLLCLLDFALIAGLSFFLGAPAKAEDSLVWSLFFELALPVIFVFCMAAMGLYDTRQRPSIKGISLRLAVAVLFALIMVFVLDVLVPGSYAAGWVLALGASAYLVLGIVRIGFYRWVDGKMLRRRILVLGAGTRAAFIDTLRRKADIRGFDLLGYLPLDADGFAVNLERILQTDKRLCEFALANRVDEIVVALDDRRARLPVQELLDCRMCGIDVIDMLDFFERERGVIQLDLLQPGWLIFSKGFAPDALRVLKKRSIDFVVSAVLFAVFFPFMLLTGLAIWLESKGKGPIFYTQTRVGKGGKNFEVIKFRSMRTDAEADGQAKYAVTGDPRITRVGAFIRKYRLDELPQIWNVLVGDMSLVGPRPERPEFVKHLQTVNPLYAERHRLSPGVTGWAQLCYPYGSSDDDSMQKLQYDLYYVKNHGLFLDLYILTQTVEVVLFKKGAV